jgi:hypothetical protein
MTTRREFIKNVAIGTAAMSVGVYCLASVQKVITILSAPMKELEWVLLE